MKLFLSTLLSLTLACGAMAQTATANRGSSISSGSVSPGGGGGGSGTVTSVSVTTANGVSGSVATPTTTPAITLTLGAITPSSVASTGAVGGTTGTFGTSVSSPFFVSGAADAADAGAIRLGNAELIAWESSPASTDVTMTVDAAEQFVFSNDLLSPSLATSLLTSSTTFALLNTTATTVNAFGAATTVNTGAAATQIWNFGGSTAASEFRFLEPSGSGTNYTGFKAQAMSANMMYIMPATFVAGGALTDAAGNGTLSWVVPTGTGTVTVVGAGSLTSTALVTGGGSQTVQTASATATMDSSGNISTPGTISSGNAATTAGALAMKQGTTQSAGTTNITLQAPTSVTSYVMTLPGAVGGANTYLKDVAGNGVLSWATVSGSPGGSTTQVQYNSSGSFAGAAGFVFDGTSQVSLGVASTTLGKLKLFGSTSGDATIQTAAAAGTSTVVTLPNASSTLPIYGAQLTYIGPTAARTVTYPDANFSVARIDAGQTFTGAQVFSTSITNSTLTSTRLVFSGAAGIQADDADLTFATDTLTFTKGVTTLLTNNGTEVTTAAAMGALAIDITKENNTKSVAVDSTFTFSGTPATAQWFGLEITNSDTNPHTLTWPASVRSMVNQATAASSVIPASGKLMLYWKYDGSIYQMYGDPSLVGTVISSSVATVSAVALTTATAANVTSISITPGVWQVTGVVYFKPAAATSSVFEATIGTTTAAISTTVPQFTSFTYSTVTSSALLNQQLPTQTVTVTSNTTYFLVAKQTFSVGTSAAFGDIRAIRIQ